MIRNRTALFNALFCRLNMHQAAIDAEAAHGTLQSRCEADPFVSYLTRLHDLYTGSLGRAERYGFVGVGCITFAENRLVEFQRRAARVLSRNALPAFSPVHVKITRKRFSVTQGEVLVEYAGQRIEQYGDNIRMGADGEYRGECDQFWIDVAKREAIARGLARA